MEIFSFCKRKELKILLEKMEKTKAFIIEAAYDSEFGACPLRRYLQHTVETMLSRKLLQGDILPGSVITVDESQENLVLRS